MTTLKESAQGFIPKQTKNIAELPTVSVDLNLLDGEGIDADGKTFTYKYVEINGEEYRVPAIVIRQLKDVLTENPNLATFKIKRSGEGLKTRYTLIPLG